MYTRNVQLSELVNYILYGEKKQEIPFKCQALDDILKEICDTPMTREKYYDMAQWGMREIFIRSLSKTLNVNVCYAGNLTITKVYEKTDKGPKFHTPIITGIYNRSCKIDIIDVLINKREKNSKLPDPIGHANVLILFGNTLLRVEPHGTNNGLLDIAIHKYFWEKDPSIVYQPPTLYCPTTQSVTKDNNCANWSLLLAYLFIHCPVDGGIDFLHGILSSKGDEYLNKLNQHWFCYMSRRVREYLLTDFEDAMLNKLKSLIERSKEIKDKDERYNMYKRIKKRVALLNTFIMENNIPRNVYIPAFDNVMFPVEYLEWLRQHG